jgi:hypothetical protein
MLTGLWTGSAAVFAEEGIGLSESGRALSVIVVAPDAPATDRYAAQVLESCLSEITGAEFVTQAEGPKDRLQPIIAIGPGAARSVAPELDLTFDSLGNEGIILRKAGPHLILTGADGASRGTLYAVHTFLQRLGVRWWSPRDSLIPRIDDLHVSDLNVRYRPPLEYREIYSIDASDPDWAVRNRINGNDSLIPPDKGGHVIYAGEPSAYFVHTFEMLVPHEEHFAQHPEWFSEINGQRVAPPDPAQLCLTNASLLEFVKQKVRRIAAEVPPNTDAIISVSQNDHSAACQCAGCRNLEADEGSPAGPLLHFVNAIADDIRTDYPRIAIDTLAYRYTRKAPRHVKPRDNVIVRLCSIECSFAQPITDPINQAFADDVRAWSKIAKRLYVWDYVTNFQHYVQPHPNLYVLGPNLRFFVGHGARGVFEQDNRHSVGGDFAVLKQWVLAQLLWDPTLDDRELIAQFVDEYYEDASEDVTEYIHLRQSAAGDTFIGISDGYDSPWLTPELLAQSYDLIQRAKSRVSGKADIAARVELLEAPLLHAIVRTWQRKQAWEILGKPWPLDRDKGFYIGELSRIIEKYNITALSEGRTEGDLQAWIKSLGVEAADVAPPPEVTGLPRRDWYDLQDSGFILVKEGIWVARQNDPSASDASAASMPGDHIQWAIQARLDSQLLDSGRDEPWTVYASIRVEADSQSGNAFSTGVYDNAISGHAVPELTVPLSDVADDEFHLYRIGAMPLGHTKFVWVAPAGNELVKQVIVDRLLFIRGNVNLKSSRVR